MISYSVLFQSMARSRAKKTFSHKNVKKTGQWTNAFINSITSRGGEDAERAIISKKCKEPLEPRVYPIIEWDIKEKRIRGTRLKIRNAVWEATMPASYLFEITAATAQGVELKLKVNMER